MEVTNEMKNAAKQYLQRRLENEGSFSSNLVMFLNAAIDEICSIISRYGVTSEQLLSNNIPANVLMEINVIIEELAADIADAVLILSQDERTDGEWFLLFLRKEFNDGWSFEDRLSQYTKNFSDQVLMAIAALSVTGVASSLWANNIKTNIRDIYNAPFVRTAAKNRLSRFAEKGFGRGVPHNMSIALDFLGKQEIANAWMQWEYEEAKSNDAIGFFIFRGSSYPCPECDEHVRYYDINEGFPLPIHSHCYCFAVYIY